MARLLLFGPGYTGRRIAEAAAASGWQVTLIRRTAADGALGFGDSVAILAAIERATHILSSIPPEGGRDALLDQYGAAIARASASWVGYLSSTGVYGDTGGAWVDEGAPLRGRRPDRIAADRAWGKLHSGSRVFRLPGIYGPGRSALDRVASGRAHRIDLAHQIFSRIHVADIVAAVLRSAETGPAGVYNLADDRPASQNAVVEEACRLLGRAPPPLLALEAAGLSPAQAAFYAENRRVSPGKAARLLGWRPRFADYRAGLRDLSAKISPISTSSAPTTLVADQR